MELNKFIGKTYEETLDKALKTLGVSQEDVVVYSNEKKGGLFKGSEYELIVTPLTDIIEYIKEYLSSMYKLIDIELTFETKIRNEQIQIKMFSNGNPLLIGKNGKNLSALELVVRQVVKNEFFVSPYISLDVENYKDKQIMYLEKTAKRIAKEVSVTKIPVEMDNMNSYERLIVHNAVANFENVTTESVGAEPNRHVVIKPKE